MKANMRIWQRIQRSVKRGGIPYLATKFVDGVSRPFGVNFESYLYGFRGDDFILSREETGIDSRFSNIYEKNYWSSSESVSGSGSELEIAEPYALLLREFINENNIKSIFDAPCGDFHWMPIAISETNCEYIGGDIVEKLIVSNSDRFPAFKFSVFDITKDVFPDVEMWHCRDCLFHLSYKDIRLALSNFVASGVPHALLTTHKSCLLRNRDIATGYFRYTDLEKPPFSFPPPLKRIKDFSPGGFPRYVGLWSADQIRTVLERNSF